jgi:hypothetical protein
VRVRPPTMCPAWWRRVTTQGQHPTMVGVALFGSRRQNGGDLWGSGGSGEQEEESGGEQLGVWAAPVSKAV